MMLLGLLLPVLNTVTINLLNHISIAYHIGSDKYILIHTRYDLYTVTINLLNHVSIAYHIGSDKYILIHTRYD